MNLLRNPIPLLLALGLLAGCATMSKKECETADWQSLGYSDGSRGIHYSNLEKRRESCSKYKIAPDDGAYRAGWDEGVRRYCTPDTGYRVGSAGQPYNNICPPDVESAFLSGWQQGVRQYCTPDNALRLGLNGHPYRGVCPPDVAGPFQDFYRLGHDVRQARAVHHNLEVQEQRTEQALAAERDPGRYRGLLHELARLRHEERRSDAQLIALEACLNDDWFDAGYRDGAAGNPERLRDVAGVCRNYGIMADRPGYRDGWREGNGVYCSYDSGLYVGQSNEDYMGVCSGFGHRQFWRGYQEGRQMFESGRYEAHPRPLRQPPARQQSPMMHQPQPRQPEQRQPEHRQPAQPGQWQPIHPAPARQQPQAQPRREMERPQPQRPQAQPQRPVEQPRPQSQQPKREMQRPIEQKSPPRATPAQPAQPTTRQPAVPAQPSPKAGEAKEKNGKIDRERRLKEILQREAEKPERATPAARP